MTEVRPHSSRHRRSPSVLFSSKENRKGEQTNGTRQELQWIVTGKVTLDTDKCCPLPVDNHSHVQMQVCIAIRISNRIVGYFHTTFEVTRLAR